MTHDRRTSDPFVVPAKRPKAGLAPVEAVEGRDGAKGNSPQRDAFRTQGREDAPSALQRVRQAARTDKQQRFTALLHHIYDHARLRAAYFALQRHAAAGVDGVEWHQYGEALEDHLEDLARRLQRGAYRAKPVRRVYLAKPDGRQRPLGVPTLEDKIVQRATVEVLTAIYDTDFLGFSYGFRPGRSPHHALDALSTALMTRTVNWVLDVDLQSFFDTLDHDWLVRFLKHRVADQRVVRLIQKWLNAGVLVDGVRTDVDTGTPQGGSISPLLANVYLHYVFDLWIHQWRRRVAHGEVTVVRYADDIVLGFQSEHDAKQCWAALADRCQRFGLSLHPTKTRLLEFGRYAAANRARRGDGRPETFNFLGFTHICGKTRRGRFTVLRQTMRTRMQAKLRAVSTALRQRLHYAIPEQGQWLRAVVQGHMRYFGVPMNTPALLRFRTQVERLWFRALRRRSQRRRVTWTRMRRYISRWLPPARVCHPYPLHRFARRT
jgi:group II intron reverse transcriptase/maturase